MPRARRGSRCPKSLLFKIDGQLAPGVTGKDVILYIIGMIGVDGALYKAMEFTGGAIRTMSMDQRLSISNMAIEAGGKAGLIEVDDITRAYMDGRTERPYTEYHPTPMPCTLMYTRSTPPISRLPWRGASAVQHAPGGRIP